MTCERELVPFRPADRHDPSQSSAAAHRTYIYLYINFIRRISSELLLVFVFGGHLGRLHHNNRNRKTDTHKYAHSNTLTFAPQFEVYMWVLGYSIIVHTHMYYIYIAVWVGLYVRSHKDIASKLFCTAVSVSMLPNVMFDDLKRYFGKLSIHSFEGMQRRNHTITRLVNNA